MARAETVDSDPYEDYAQQLMTGEAVALDLRATSFFLRAAGSAIDFVVYMGAYVAILLTLFNVAGTLGLDDALIAAVSVSGGVLCLLAIPVTVETLSHGKSLGRLAVGARIVRDDGGAAGFRHAVIRGLVGVMELFLSFGAIAGLVGLLNARAKRLGDLVAGTYSQYERVSSVNLPSYGVPESLVEWSKTADVAKLPDALARRVAQFLHSAQGFTPDTRERLARSLANEVSVYVSPVPMVHPELFLAAAAAMRREREFTALQLEQQRLARLGSALGGQPHGFPERG
ncbi:MAG: RDD family protein [Rhodoglobus sp.]